MSRRCLIAFVTTIAGAPSAMALEATNTVYVAASPKAVWKVVGDFCGIANWDPWVTKCEISHKGSDTFRTLTVKNGNKLLQKQLIFNDAALAYSYSTLEGSQLVANLTATLSVTPNGAGSTVTWSSSFAAKRDEAAAIDAVSRTHQRALDSLVLKFKPQPKPKIEIKPAPSPDPLDSQQIME